MSNTGIEVEGVESPVAGLSKNCRREVLFPEDAISQKPLPLYASPKSVVGEEAEACQIVCGVPQTARRHHVMVVSRCSTAWTTAISKGKNPWFESSNTCSLGELGI